MNATTASADWLAWQLCDSAFPMGGFAHSLGLEAAYQLGHVDGEASLVRFVHESLANTRSQSLPWAKRAATAASAAELAAIDHECDRFLTNPVANRASKKAGRAFLIAARAAFGDDAAALDVPHAHLAPIAGWVMARIGLPFAQIAAVQLFWALRAILSSAVRLGCIGPLAAQKVQAGIGPVLDRELLRAIHDDAQPASTAPLLELLQMTQDQLYSRLFQS